MTQRDDIAYQCIACISEAIAKTPGKDYPARYFAKAVAGMLPAAGYWTKVEPW